MGHLRPLYPVRFSLFSIFTLLASAGFELRSSEQTESNLTNFPPPQIKITHSKPASLSQGLAPEMFQALNNWFDFNLSFRSFHTYLNCLNDMKYFLYRSIIIQCLSDLLRDCGVGDPSVIQLTVFFYLKDKVFLRSGPNPIKHLQPKFYSTLFLKHFDWLFKIFSQSECLKT